MITSYDLTAIQRDAWIDTYTTLTERWMNLDPVKAMPPMGVRLLAIRSRRDARISFDSFLKAITVNPGEVERLVMKEFEIRHFILFDMVDRNSAGLSAHELWAVKRGLADDLEAALCIEGRERLRKFLDRLVRRYWRYETETPRIVN